MKQPVLVKIPTRPERAKSEDGLCTLDAPARPGDVHSVLHEVAASTLDNPGSDWQAFAQISLIAEHVSFGEKVIGAFVGTGSFALGQPAQSRAAPNPSGYVAGPTLQDGEGSFGHPTLGCFIA